MKSKLVTYSLMLSLFFSCKEETSTLPFYNSAEWESEWIEESSEAYTDIHKIADFSFTDQNNQKVTNANFDGRLYVADFFFTTCPSICPEMTSNMYLLQEEFRDEPKFKLLSHSVTPWIDTVQQLKRYAVENQVDDKKWHLVTGEKAQIYDLARTSYFIEGQMGLQLSSDDFLHTENFILIDKKRRIRGIYNGTLEREINRLISDIKLLLEVD